MNAPVVACFSKTRPNIEAHAKYLKEHGDAKTILQGNTDERGTREYNLSLGQRRSEAFGRLADATTPDAETALIYRLKDEVDALDVEVSIADLEMNWAREDRYARMYIVKDPAVSSPRLTEAFKSLSEWRRHYEETFRKSRLAQLELEREKRK